MHFGVAFCDIGPFSEPAGAAAMGRAAEEAGFDSIWTVEHVLIPLGYESTYPYDPSGKMPAPDDFALPDPIVWLAYVAACTTTLKLATGILILPQRNPAILGKAAASLDRLSGGRLLLGVGGGWLEEEFDALGIPFADRGRRFDEYMRALRALWSDGPTSFDGDFVHWTDVMSHPKPVDGGVPLIIGGHSEVAARRAGRLGDGFFPGNTSIEELERLIGIMRASADEAGRDPDAIEITAGAAEVLGADPLDAVATLADLGVDRIAIPPLAFDPDGIGPALASFGENVISKVS
jgi:probable F420-dependent oxidoreductase